MWIIFTRGRYAFVLYSANKNYFNKGYTFYDTKFQHPTLSGVNVTPTSQVRTVAFVVSLMAGH
jgi:hypothetical protein